MTNITIRSILGWFLLAPALCPLSMTALGQEPSQQLSDYELVAHLQSRDIPTIAKALEHFPPDFSQEGPHSLRLINGNEVSASVRSALIEALTYAVEQNGAYSDGKPYDENYIRSMPHEWIGNLADLVVALKDESAIPILMQTTGFGWLAVYALLDFGPMVISPAIECAESDVFWTQAVTGCLMLLNTAIRIWPQQISSQQLMRLHVLVQKHLSKPITAYKSGYKGASYVMWAADLALALGWTGEYRALTHARLDEIDPEDYWVWVRDDILKSLSGELSSPAVAKVVREWKQ